MYLKEHPDVRLKIEAKLFPLIGLRAEGAPAATNGTAPSPEAAKAAAAARPQASAGAPAPAAAARR